VRVGFCIHRDGGERGGQGVGAERDPAVGGVAGAVVADLEPERLEHRADMVGGQPGQVHGPDRQRVEQRRGRGGRGRVLEVS
jgi:hypothetical protein